MHSNDTEKIIELLMEETGCERADAEFALSLSNNNIEKAIIKLGIIQKHITVFKIKLMFPMDNFYGLLHIAINTKTSEILRFSIVFSHNPQTYEISAETDWFSFEKAIFAARLEKGTMEKYTKKLEGPLKTYISRIINESTKMPNEEIIRAFFNPLNIKIEIIKEQVNVQNFKKLPNFDTRPAKKQVNQDTVLYLEVIIIEDPNGKSIDEIKVNDQILTLITDERDIANYLANLIGAQKDGKMIPIPAIVTRLTKENEIFEIHLQYNASIKACVRVKSGTKLSQNPQDEEKELF